MPASSCSDATRQLSSVEALGWLLVSLLCLLGVPAYALERLVPYDDFNATHIDPDKWFGVEPGGLGTEAIRQIQDNRLRLVSRGYGKTDADSEVLENGHKLFLPNAAAITVIQTTVQVNDMVATGCRGNPTSTETFAGSGDFLQYRHSDAR